VTDYFQFIDPVSFKKPAEADCHPARTHDVHSQDAPENEICPGLICLFDHKHFNRFATGNKFEAELVGLVAQS
jgi:hypothetical protein